MPDVEFTHVCSDGTALLCIWDSDKDETNQEDHGISFEEAAAAFCDPKRVVVFDWKHSTRQEKRFFLYGKLESGRILTVRYTRRDKYIRIIGAGFWRYGYTQYQRPKRI